MDSSSSPRLRRMSAVLPLIARFLLAGVWIYSALTKLADPAATSLSVVAYEIFDYDTSVRIGEVLPWAELALGILLLAGIKTRWAAVVSALVLVGFIAGIASAWARGLTIDCGCFGSGGFTEAVTGKTYALEILRDVLFLAAAVTVWKWPIRWWALYP